MPIPAEQPRCWFDGKITFPSPQTAWRAANKINRENKHRSMFKEDGTRPHSRAYQCTRCHRWHVTSRPEREDLK